MSLFDRLRGKPTESSFAKALLAAIKQQGDPRQLVYDQEQFMLHVPGTADRINLRNIYQEHLSLDQTDRPGHLETLARVFCQSETELPEDFEEAKSHLRPKVYCRSTFANMELVNKVRGDKRLNIPLYALGDHLLMSLVYDQEYSMRSISGDDLEKWGTTFYEAMEIAKTNLERTTVAWARMGDNFHSSMSGDNYDSSRVLLTDQIGEFSVLGDHVAVVPQRDALYVTGTNDPTGLGILLDFVEKAYQNDPRPLSPIPLRLREGEWEDWDLPMNHEHFERYHRTKTQFLGTMYADQKELLEGECQPLYGDVFVASYSGIESQDGTKLRSYSVWGEGVDTLLPRTDLIAFGQLTGEPCLVDWSKAREIIGHLMLADDELYPVRYRVREFPDEQSMETLRQFSEAN
ncbi:MAG: hypothetical protein KDA80_24630 [Planctomycetaceae bacterium]|nr:hypothetical protein [Planctomycetaceae bacterium]